MNRPKDGSDPNNLSDEALVSATLRGNKGAYQVLVERYQGRLLRVALDILKNASDAEDVVQESFVKAFLSLDKFKNQASFYTWLHRITFNMAVDLQRKNQRRGGQHFEYKEDFSVSSSVGSKNSSATGGSATSSGATGGAEVPFSQNIEGPQEALLRHETGKKINQVFASLSDEHRAVITLREVDGLDYEEIAAALGVPRGTVMSRLFYARKALQQALKELAPESARNHIDGDVEDMRTPSALKSAKRARG
jgi:RNA polymerase sigma-70 factor (ECF subfamily)